MRGSTSLGILFLIFFCLFPFLCVGQDKDLTIYFEKDSIEIQEGITLLNALIVENLHPDSLFLDISGEFMKNALLGLPSQLRLGPLESLKFPLKYLASTSLINQQDQVFTFKVRSTHKARSSTINVSFKTKVLHKERLSVQINPNEVYLYPGLEKSNINVSIINPGLLPVEFKVKLENLPKGFEILGIEERHQLTGNAKKDILISLKHPNFEGKSIDVYSSLEVLLEKRINPLRYPIRFLNLGSKVDLIEQPAMPGNFSVSSNELNYLGSNFINSIQWSSTSDMYFAKNKKLDFGLQYNYYPSQSTYQLFNSHVHYADSTWGIYLGSLNENLNYNLNGKGIKGTYRWQDQRINALFMDNDMVVLGNELGIRPAGYNVALEYLRGPLTKETSRYLAVLNRRPDLKSKGAMMNLEQQIIRSGFQKMRIEGGLSINKLNAFKDQVVEMGYAGGVRYGFQTEKFALQSFHYYSHPNFTGNRSGVLQSDVLFDYKPTSGRTYLLGWNFNQNKMKSNGMEYAEFLNGLLVISQMNLSVAVQQKLSRNWSVSGSPYYMQQQMERLNQSNEIEPNRSKSWRFRNSWSYFEGGKSMNLNFDQGLTEQQIGSSNKEWFYSLRINTQLTAKAFSFTMFYQYNPYFLSDGLSNMKFGQYHILTVEPKYARSFLHNTLDLSSSLMFYYHGDSKNSNYVWNGQIAYQIKPGLQLKGDFYFGINKVQRMMMYNPETGIDPTPIVYNRRDPTFFSTRQIRIGIKKDLKFNNRKNHAQLTMQFFHDRNGNGVREQGETWASGIMVEMKGQKAQSEKNGKVTFKVLKGETYSFQLQSHKGWILSNDAKKQFVIQKNETYEIPLVKMTLVKGNISQVVKAYQQPITDFSDYQVLIRNDNGALFEARTNADGRFIVFLPEGNYRAEIIPKQGFVDVVENGKHFQVKEGEELDLSFQILNAERKIRIQQF